jgi:hypothetical protein
MDTVKCRELAKTVKLATAWRVAKQQKGDPEQ